MHMFFIVHKLSGDYIVICCIVCFSKSNVKSHPLNYRHRILVSNSNTLCTDKIYFRLEKCWPMCKIC